MTTSSVDAREQVPLPPMGAVGFARWSWRQLTSMRTALILLFLLAIASIPGSVLPQRGNDPIAVRNWIEDAPTMGPILDRLGFFEVYSSPWFSAVYLLLFISLVGCVIPRAAQHWRAMLALPPAPPRNLSRLAGTIEQTSGLDPQQVIDSAASVLRKQRWRVRVEEPAEAGSASGSSWVAAEKGYLRETGNLVFHLSLVLLLVAVAVGGLFGWKGNVIVREGRGFANTLTQYDAWGGGAFVNPATLPDFSFTLTDFRVDFERSGAQRGAPSFFEADVTYRTNVSAAEQTDVIEVNHPLEISGAKIFLVGHGYAPKFVVRDAAGKVVFDDEVPFLPQDGNFTSTGVVKAPDGTPQLGFRGLFLPTSALDDVRGPHSVFPAPDDPSVFLSAWQGDLGLDAGAPQSVYRLDTVAMTQLGLEALRPGDIWVLPNGSGSVTMTGFTRWASFQIARDPGKEFALVSAILAITGLMCSLFMRRRRVWVRATQAANGITVVQVAGLARKSTLDDLQSPSLEAELRDLANALRGPEIASSTVKEPK